MNLRLPHIPLETEALESNYYDGPRAFGAETVTGEFCLLADLGLFAWLAKLTANGRMRFVASGIGTQLFPALFKTP